MHRSRPECASVPAGSTRLSMFSLVLLFGVKNGSFEGEDSSDEMLAVKPIDFIPGGSQGANRKMFGGANQPL